MTINFKDYIASAEDFPNWALFCDISPSRSLCRRRTDEIAAYVLEDKGVPVIVGLKAAFIARLSCGV